jgi:hypothetical protein
MRTPRRIPIVALVLAGLGLFVAGCGWEFPGLQASPLTSPLVTIEVRGGECPEGACGGTTVVERDGRVHATAPVRAELGTVEPSLLDALATEIREADFEAIAARPFTGECPTAFDGQETIFTFETAAGRHRFASCEVVVDTELPLFAAALAAAGSVAP